MKIKILISALSLLLLASCASGPGRFTNTTPVVDLERYDAAVFEQDLSTCRMFADSVDIKAQAAEGAVETAILGGVTGLILGDPSFAGEMTAIGILTGGAAGMAGGLE